MSDTQLRLENETAKCREDAELAMKKLELFQKEAQFKQVGGADRLKGALAGKSV